MMGRAASQTNLPDQVREIATLDRGSCIERWAAVFGAAPPRYLSVPFMQRVLARELQIRELGNYPPQIRRALKAALGDGQRGEQPRRSTSPGSHLLREWNGRTYRVEVTASGYVLDGQTYASLSTAAKRITGAHWSGPRFFGLTPKRAG
jgi:hypothetical protein